MQQDSGCFSLTALGSHEKKCQAGWLSPNSSASKPTGAGPLRACVAAGNPDGPLPIAAKARVHKGPIQLARSTPGAQQTRSGKFLETVPLALTCSSNTHHSLTGPVRHLGNQGRLVCFPPHLLIFPTTPQTYAVSLLFPPSTRTIYEPLHCLVVCALAVARLT